MKLSFTKMQGCANDYIYLDCRESGVPENIAALSQDLSRRHFSIGADGIICICAPVTAGADGRMRIFNADGSEAQMCGNGVRCVAEWLYTHGIAKETLVVDTNSGTEDHHPQGPPALAGGDGRILRHGGGSARREYGRRPAGGLPPHRGGTGPGVSPASAWATPTASPSWTMWTA